MSDHGSAYPVARSWMLPLIVVIIMIALALVGVALTTSKNEQAPRYWMALVPIYAFYFLLEKQGINQQWRDYLPMQDSKFKDEAVFVIDAISGYIVAFFRGQVLVAMCDGVLYTIGFVLIGLPYALLIGVMATILTIIPFLGAITTCVSGSWKRLPAKATCSTRRSTVMTAFVASRAQVAP